MQEATRFVVEKVTPTQIGRGLDHGQSACVVNILQALLDDSSAILYLPKGDYKPLGGKRGRDPRILEEPLARSLEVVGLICGSNGRQTVTVRVLKEVKVLPDGGPGRAVAMNVWRSYAIVRDRRLEPALKQIEVSSLQQQTFNRLTIVGAIEDEAYDPAKTYTIDLEGRPIASAGWAHPHTLKFVDLLRREQDLLVVKRALLSRKRTLSLRVAKKTRRSPTVSTAATSPAIAATLPIYKERLVSEELESQRPSQQFEQVQTVVYKLLGYTPPSFKSTSGSRDEVDEKLREVNRELERVRCRARLMVIAMEEHKAKGIPWGAPHDGRKGAKYQIAVLDGAELRRITKVITCERNSA